MRALLFIFLLTLFGHGDDGKDKHHHFYKKDLTFLSLDDTQKVAVKKILHEYRKELKDFKKEKIMLLKERQKIFLDDTFQSEKLEEKYSKIDKMRNDIEAKFLENMHAILNPIQREKFIHYLHEWEID